MVQVERLPSMHKALVPSPAPQRNKNNIILCQDMPLNNYFGKRPKSGCNAWQGGAVQKGSLKARLPGFRLLGAKRQPAMEGLCFVLTQTLPVCRAEGETVQESGKGMGQGQRGQRVWISLQRRRSGLLCL